MCAFKKTKKVSKTNPVNETQEIGSSLHGLSVKLLPSSMACCAMAITISHVKECNLTSIETLIHAATEVILLSNSHEVILQNHCCFPQKKHKKMQALWHVMENNCNCLSNICIVVPFLYMLHLCDTMLSCSVSSNKLVMYKLLGYIKLYFQRNHVYYI